MAKIMVDNESIATGGSKKIELPLFGVFTFVGLLVTVCAGVSLLLNRDTNSLITFAVVTGIFGIPFGYLIGFRNIRTIQKRKAMIKNGQVYLYIDEIVDKTHIFNSSEPDDPKEYQLTTKAYSEKTGKNVLVSNAREFKAAKVGDACILCFTTMSKRPFMVFPGSQYVLSEELQKKCVDSIDRIPFK